MNHIQYTESQNKAIAAFKAFLEGDEQVFMLKGAAGTGKTTLLMEFLKILEGQKRVYGLMAPTGRAAYILGSKTGKPAFTIHRSIYGLSKLKSTSQNKEDEDDGGLHLRFVLRGNTASLKTVYIVDESSMVADNFRRMRPFHLAPGIY